MKKFFILIAGCLISLMSYAQLQKGDWLTSLNGNAQLTNVPDMFSSSDVTVSAGTLKFVANNLGVGLSLATNFNHVKYMGHIPDNVIPLKRSFGLEPAVVVRKYFGNYKLRPYAEIDFGWKFMKESYFDANGDTFYRSSTGNVGFIRPVVGLSYWLTDKVAIDMNAKYEFLFRPSGGNNIHLNLGFSVKF